MYFGDTNIWAAHSVDLMEWTVVENPVLQPRPGYFDSRLVEPGPQPVMTERGILLLYGLYRDGHHCSPVVVEGAPSESHYGDGRCAFATGCGACMALNGEDVSRSVRSSSA